MEVFRLSKEMYSGGLVASGSANRWNRRGQFVIYAGSSRSLSTLESIVHRSSVIPTIPYKILVISISDDEHLVKQIRLDQLQDNWRTMAAYSALQEIGSLWYERKETMILRVPSAVIVQEYNYILNMEHPDFANEVRLARVEDYFWDDRLVG
jgi:RES domain-containing protein